MRNLTFSNKWDGDGNNSVAVVHGQSIDHSADQGLNARLCVRDPCVIYSKNFGNGRCWLERQRWKLRGGVRLGDGLIHNGQRLHVDSHGALNGTSR